MECAYGVLNATIFRMIAKGEIRAQNPLPQLRLVRRLLARPLSCRELGIHLMDHPGIAAPHVQLFKDHDSFCRLYCLNRRFRAGRLRRLPSNL